MVLQRITAKLALASHLALQAHRYQFSSYVFISSGIICLFYRIHQSLIGNSTSLWLFAVGAFCVWIGWWCNRLSDTYFQDIQKIYK